MVFIIRQKYKIYRLLKTVNHFLKVMKMYKLDKLYNLFRVSNVYKDYQVSKVIQTV